MRNSLLSIAVLSALAVPTFSYAEETVEPAATAEAPSNFTATSNIGFVSDYYTRGISQSWHKPALQGGIDIAHSSGLFVGVWGSTVSPNTFPDAAVELDLYGGYNGTIDAVEGLGYSVGAIGYFYPGGSWKKYRNNAGVLQAPKGGRWDTYEANVGLSYKWLSAKASVTLGDWFGAEKATGFTSGSNGTTYIELNAAYPLPWYDLTLIGHVGRLNVTAKLDPAVTGTANERSPDYTDYKIGLSKSFKIASSEGWNAGVYYVGATNGGNGGYWGPNGFGGPSFNGSTEVKDLADDRLIVTIGRVF